MNTKSPQLQGENDTDEISLRDIILTVKKWFNFLLKRWWIIVLAGILGGVCGIVYAISQKPIYTATTTFVLEEGEGNGIGQYAGMAAMVGIDIGGGGGGLFQGENIIELYKSRAMLQKALLSSATFDGKKQLLIDRYLDFNKIRKNWSDPRLKGLSFGDKTKLTFLHDSILGEVVKKVKTGNIIVDKLNKKMNILKVEVKSADEEFAKRFNDQLVSTVNNFYIETKTKKSLENVTILQRQTDSVRAVMSGSIFSSARTVDATPNLNPARQVLRAGAQSSQFNAETNKLMLAEMLKNLEISKMTLRKETPLIQVIDQPIFPLSKEKFGRLKGLILGGVLFGFLTTLFLITRRLYTETLNEK